MTIFSALWPPRHPQAPKLMRKQLFSVIFPHSCAARMWAGPSAWHRGVPPPGPPPQGDFNLGHICMLLCNRCWCVKNCPGAPYVFLLCETFLVQCWCANNFPGAYYLFLLCETIVVQRWCVKKMRWKRVKMRSKRGQRLKLAKIGYLGPKGGSRWWGKVVKPRKIIPSF